LFDSLLNRTVQPMGCDASAFAEQLSEYMSDREPGDAFSIMTPAPKGPGSERRAAARFERLAGTKVLIDGAVVDLVDLSVTGAQVLSATRILRPRESVQVKLWKEADGISCDGAIVWSSFETSEAMQTPCYRAGITFEDAGQRALEQLYFAPCKALVPIRSQDPAD
jgi:hypothetical protein